MLYYLSRSHVSISPILTTAPDTALTKLEFWIQGSCAQYAKLPPIVTVPFVRRISPIRPVMFPLRAPQRSHIESLNSPRMKLDFPLPMGPAIAVIVPPRGIVRFKSFRQNGSRLLVFCCVVSFGALRLCDFLGIDWSGGLGVSHSKLAFAITRASGRSGSGTSSLSSVSARKTFEIRARAFLPSGMALRARGISINGARRRLNSDKLVNMTAGLRSCPANA